MTAWREPTSHPHWTVLYKKKTWYSATESWVVWDSAGPPLTSTEEPNQPKQFKI